MGSIKRDKEFRTGVNTRVIHHKENFSEETGSIMPPIFPTSTFVHGNESGFDYTRSGNPNFRILESVLSDLEECHVSPWLSCNYSVLLPLTILINLIVSGANVSGMKIRITWTEKPVSVTPNADDIQLFSIGMVFSHHLNLKFLSPYLKIFYFHKGPRAT